MPDEYVDARISDLTAADSISDDDLFVLEQSAIAKKLPGLILKNMATNAGSAAGAAAGQAFVQAAEAAADDAQDAAEAAAQAASDAADILDDVEAAGTQALADIEDAADDSLADIAAANTSALSNISSAKTAATDAIASEKTEAMADIEAAVDEVEDSLYDIDGLKDTLLVENSKSGTFITVEDAAPVTAKELTLTLEPHQNLNGYDHPWPAGGGKNKAPWTIDTLKAQNTAGTWSGNNYTMNGVTFAVEVNAGGAVTKITANGSASGNPYIAVDYIVPAGSYILSGCPTGGTISSSFSVRIRNTSTDEQLARDFGSEASFTLDTDAPCSAYCIFNNGYTANNVIFYPMLRLASESDATFAPYSNICPIEGWTGAEINRTEANAWDEEYRQGYYNISGIFVSATNQLCTKNRIPVRANTSYYLKLGALTIVSAQGVGVCYFDKDGTFVERVILSGNTLTIPNGVASILINFSAAYGTTYNNDISINYPATDTEYHKGEVQKIIANICINQWDEVLEDGAYNSTGGKQAAAGYKRSANLIPVMPNTNYFLKVPTTYTNFRVCRYKTDGTGIDRVAPTYNGVFNTGNDTYFISFHIEATTYNHDISINYPASFTDYFPYTGNDVAYSGTIDLGTGKMVLDKRKQTATSLAGSSPNFYTSVSPAPSTTNQLDIICDKMKTASSVNAEGVYINANTAIMFKTSAYSTASELMEAFGGEVSFLYPLATPITIQLTPAQLQMLKGLNYIWTDADDMELVYCYVKDGKSVVVGNAEQLLSKEMVNDQEPYLFRPSGGDGADREYDTLVGGTVAWNQISEYGNFENTTGWSRNSSSTFTVENNVLTHNLVANNSNNRIYSNPGIPTKIGNKYLLAATIQAVSAATVYGLDLTNGGGLNSNNISITTTPAQYCVIKQASAETSYITIGYRASSETEFSVKYSKVMLFDLTAIFGSTIADYAYSLEQATAGSGIAWLKKYGFFTKPYYPYNAGELMSVKALRHKMVGFNLFDADVKMIERGWTRLDDGSFYISTGSGNGNVILWSNDVNYSGQICISLTLKYSVNDKAGARFAFLYEDGTTEAPAYGYHDTFYTTRVLSNANKKVVSISMTYGSGGVGTWMKDICINFSGTRNGEYEPYKTWSYPLDPKLTLQGIYKLNGDKLYCDGDRYYPNKGVERHYKLVDLGTLTYTKDSTSNVFRCTLTDLPLFNSGNSVNEICSNGWGSVYTSTDALADKTFTFRSNGYLYFRDDSLATAYTNNEMETVKSAMSGVYLLYELATPYFEPADPFEELQALDPYGTEEYIDDREVPIPVGHDTNYPVNLRAEIERVMKEVPPPPTSNGTYILKVTVASGVPTYSWVAQ